MAVVTRIKKTAEDFQEDLRVQLRRLHKSSGRFDQGDDDEAITLAGIIRVFVKENPVSLLSHLGIKEQMQFWDLMNMPQGSLAFVGLRMNPENDWKYDPKLDIAQRRRSFDGWWNGVIMRNWEGEEYTRSDVVINLAETDGSAHVDSGLKPSYHKLSRGNAFGWQSSTTGENPFTNVPVFPFVRTIAHELENSIIEHLSITGNADENL